MSARVYFMKRVTDFKDVSIMSPEENSEVYSVCILQFSRFTKYNRMRGGRPTRTISCPSHILLIFLSEPPRNPHTFNIIC